MMLLLVVSVVSKELSPILAIIMGFLLLVILVFSKMHLSVYWKVKIYKKGQKFCVRWCQLAQFVKSPFIIQGTWDQNS